MKLIKIKLALLIATFLFTAGVSQPIKADELDISQNPLFLAASIDPNIMFTLDDSGSMQWEFMPDDTMTFNTFGFPRPAAPYSDGTQYTNQVAAHMDDNLHHYWQRSSNNNAVFYNPDREYRPWVEPDGTEMDDADPTCALYNIRRPDQGCLDLTSEASQYALWFWNTTNQNIGQASGAWQTRDFWPITYFNYIAGDPLDRDSYQLVQITDATPAGAIFISPGGVTRTRDEEIQNFANWFQYHRSRVLTARAGIGRAFLELPQNVRLGFGTINAPNADIDGVNTRTIVDPVRQLDQAGREAFYDRLYDWPIPTSGTPLRRAANDVGQYFERSDNRGPWSDTPGVNTPGENPSEHLSCRQSFHILMTDGFWNGPAQGFGNVDNTTGPVIEDPAGNTFQYTPSDPFRDAFSDTLADIAMHYWKRDLRPNLDNRVPTNAVNPAFWQHLSTYGIGLGVLGSIDPQAAFDAIESGDEIEWPEPFANAGAPNIDDLLHFGLNGRGGFFSAMDPDVFAQELGAILRDIVARASASTGVAVSATRLTTDALVYAAEFDSNDWSGELWALNADTGAVEWRASQALQDKGWNNRQIFSFDPQAGQGIAFSPAAPVLEQRLMTDVGGVPWTVQDLIDYIRGNDALEGGLFRPRSSMLADIVNSRPVFSGRGNDGWARLDADYLQYIDEDKQDIRDCDPDDDEPCKFKRKDTVFIGSNGGMLHAFDARADGNGEELFAYVPSTVHRHLHEFAHPDYGHRFFVDGQLTVADAKPGSGWGTYLVGTLGAGGRGVYALDVTRPQNFSAANVLWELSSDDDPDIGYTFGEPLITRLPGGPWVAVFGNGYNSQDGQAYLFVVRLSDGHVLHKLALGDPGGNGLSGVIGWRDPATRTELERVYAGDLNGTIWRVDFDSGSPVVTYSDGLFSDPTGRAITSTPNISAHPSGGMMVYFGSGKFIENSDRTETVMDRFFAIRDQDTEVTVNNINQLSNVLSEVTMAMVPPEPGKPPRRTLVNPEGINDTGWFVDLAVGASTGERVLVKPRVIFGNVIFGTFEPVADPCTPGGIQRVYVLDALSGDGRLPFCPNCGATQIGSGAPFAPPISIRQRPPGELGDGAFPGFIDPDDPPDPEDLPAPPPDAAPDAARVGWCSEFGIPPLFEGGAFISLGTICEGRQVWRDMR